MWRGEDDSKAQPDVADPALGLATIRDGPAGREVAGPGTGGPWGARRASRTRSERAALGRAGPAGEVTGCGLLGWLCVWEPQEAWLVGWGAGWGAAGRKRRGRSARKGETPGLTERGLLDWRGRPDPSSGEMRTSEATKAPQ